jgi:transcriptional regulator with XRE-family HTH domain
MEARDYVAALIERGLTQQQIADRVEIPQPTISKIARGEVKDVLSRNYRKLQALYDEVVAAANPAPGAPGDRRHDDDRRQEDRRVNRRHGERRGIGARGEG